MKVPVSWLKEFVDLPMPLEELAHALTMAGLEVEEIRYVGLPMPKTASEGGKRQEIKISGLEWDAEKIVVGAIYEVNPHPNADRLVLCQLDDGQRIHTVLTGAPNLFPYKGKGPLPKPIKVAYAKEGARIYDGHQPGQVLTTLKRAKIRGVESYSMACSEKELGISDEHEGIIFLDDDAPVGMPLVEYMGDAVLDIAITPNIARAASIYGVAREVAAITRQPLRPPALSVMMSGAPIEGRVSIQIQDPELNPRFMLGLIEGVEIRPSPYWVQRRLRLAGMRPINNIVDATNYAMLELGEPLHAFDYDKLVRRAGGKPPVITTRPAKPGERLLTLDHVERILDDFTILVCDGAGPLSIAGVMGGAESEVDESTRNVLLEAATWNLINIRRTVVAQNLPSEAAYRFSRGVHPAMAECGLLRGLELMRQWSGGVVAQGIVDAYPKPYQAPTLSITAAEVKRQLGIALGISEIREILERLEFQVRQEGETLIVRPPDHRLDIGEGVIGVADLMEEIARIYGYERIPATRLADELPPQRSDPLREREEMVRDLLVNLGLQEVITYRMTSTAREARLPLVFEPPVERAEPIRLKNPIAPERSILRQGLLVSLLEAAERNARLQPRLALFEIGSVYWRSVTEMLPEELLRLGIVLCGQRAPAGWQTADIAAMDFYDLKGILESLFRGIHLEGVRFIAAGHPAFHPGKCAEVYLGDRRVGCFGELHPLIKERFELPEAPVLAAELDLHSILSAMPDRYTIEAVPAYPPVLEDIAVIVDEEVPAERVEQCIWAAGGKVLRSVRLFDVYRGEQIGVGKKSLAYSLTYQAEDRTLTDEEAAQIRNRIVRRLEQELGARLRG
ncbi:MAG: phenylalanine--tRNA ligase subunit beta [Anaerolineales bacterium]|nr:phenylalanine--tRNA ligase subunit beta [Anaerolineales bacterium]MDW8447873.1 phenylalanine--tRNA ligase subunit beta [Anaerolineales bacterium]